MFTLCVCMCIWDNGDQKTHSDMRTVPPKLASGMEIRKGWETLKTGQCALVVHTHTHMDKLKLRTCFSCPWARGPDLTDSAKSALFYFLQNPVNIHKWQFVIFLFCFLLSSTFLSNISLPVFFLGPPFVPCAFQTTRMFISELWMYIFQWTLNSVGPNLSYLCVCSLFSAVCFSPNWTQY